jgi:hypothetical protein
MKQMEKEQGFLFNIHWKKNDNQWKLFVKPYL